MRIVIGHDALGFVSHERGHVLRLTERSNCGGILTAPGSKADQQQWMSRRRESVVARLFQGRDVDSTRPRESRATPNNIRWHIDVNGAASPRQRSEEHTSELQSL